MRTIVIVDDNAPFRTLVRAMLSADGFTVVGEAREGTAAIEVIRRTAPDLVLLDVELPDLDGFAVLQRLGLAGDSGDADREARPIVVLTSSRGRVAYQHRLVGSGAAGFVAKDELSGDALREIAKHPR